jgi:hypothetical protein
LETHLFPFEPFSKEEYIYKKEEKGEIPRIADPFNSANSSAVQNIRVSK